MLNLEKLPEGYQTVYVYYSGMGEEQYFTAPSMQEAGSFVLQEKGVMEWHSAFPTHFIMRASGSYFIRGGVPVRCMEEFNVIRIASDANDEAIANSALQFSDWECSEGTLHNANEDCDCQNWSSLTEADFWDGDNSPSE